MKKIALVIDKNGWALEHVAQYVKKYVKDYEIDIIAAEAVEGNTIKLFLVLQDYDLIHFVWREYLLNIDSEYTKNYCESIGLSHEEFKEKYILNKKISFQIPDELFLEDKEKIEKLFKYSQSYFVTSEKLFNKYNEFDVKPKMVIHDGVDLELYKNNNKKRFEDEYLKVCWCGNSNFTDSTGDNDLKGVKGILKPAIKELQDEGYKIKLELRDRDVNGIPNSKMPGFLNTQDVYICTSKTEGTPLVILEAMAVGLGVVTTDVGIVREAFGEKQKECIIERNIESLKAKLIELMNNRKFLKELSKENEKNIDKFNWKNIANDYNKFFKGIVSK